MFRKPSATAVVQLISRGTQSAPERRLQKLRAEELRPGDEAWLVIDRDQWPEEQFKAIEECLNDQYHLAVSNPCFELWILYHIDDGKGVNTSKDCKERLDKLLPNFNKSNCCPKDIKDGISKAISRAQALDRPPCKTWPEKKGSTVYRLVQKLGEAGLGPSASPKG